MYVNIGRNQLNNLYLLQVNPEELTSFLESLLKELNPKSKYYEPMRQLKFHYQTLSNETFIENSKELKRLIRNNHALVEEYLTSISKTVETKNEKYIYAIVANNKIEKEIFKLESLPGRIRRFFTDPD